MGIDDKGGYTGGNGRHRKKRHSNEMCIRGGKGRWEKGRVKSRDSTVIIPLCYV